jgi:hypothetical protein
MLKTLLTTNQLTTIFGILAGLPVLVATSLTSMNVTITPAWTHVLGFIGAAGLIGLGIVAKSFNTHSTVAQVEASTAVVTNNPQASALVAAADAQVQGKK